MANAIIYTRVSTDEQADKGYSLRDQKDRLERYCTLKGMNMIAHYQDDHSAKTFERPEFNKLLAFAKENKHQIDYLLVVKWDRFSRNVTDALMMLRTFKTLGIIVDAAEQPVDLSVPENKLMLSFYLTAPEVENDRRSMNTAAGMRRAKKEGRWVASAPVGYKYVRDSMNKPMLVKTEKAALVLEAFELYATGIHEKEEVRKRLLKKGLKISKTPFCNMLRNTVYCGLIQIPADRSEEEQVVKGVHEAIVSMDLFEQVQMVAQGKQRIQAKPKKVSELLPMRGYLVCSRCGKNLTGSASKGNGGIYYYYHCHPGCKERHKSDVVHQSFTDWLHTLSIDPAISELYVAVMQDIFKNEEGDRDKEVQRIDKELKQKQVTLAKAAEKLVSDELDKWGYNVLKENLFKEIAGLQKRQQDLRNLDDGFTQYLKYGFMLLSNLETHYSEGSIEAKRKFLGLIFPEKLIFENNTYRTTKQSDLLTLLFNTDKGFKEKHKEKAFKNESQFYKVAPTGLEPVSKV